MYYCQDIETTHTLTEEESLHCVQVLRGKVGDEVEVTDGMGTIFHCRIVVPHRKHCEVEILSREVTQPLHTGYVHIAIAPTKNIDRLEWMIEKCTEIGVDEITPILCEHSERKTVNSERLQKIMISAAKQSLKARFPRLNPLTRLRDLLPDGDRLIAHCIEGYAATDSKHALRDHIVAGHKVTILIGPEGDFSQDEVNWALQNGYQPVSLGPARLRTETAGVVACHTAILLNE